jgi:hypothetical protein
MFVSVLLSMKKKSNISSQISMMSIRVLSSGNFWQFAFICHCKITLLAQCRASRPGHIQICSDSVLFWQVRPVFCFWHGDLCKSKHELFLTKMLPNGRLKNYPFVTSGIIYLNRRLWNHIAFNVADNIVYCCLVCIGGHRY